MLLLTSLLPVSTSLLPVSCSLCDFKFSLRLRSNNPTDPEVVVINRHEGKTLIRFLSSAQETLEGR